MKTYIAYVLLILAIFSFSCQKKGAKQSVEIELVLSWYNQVLVYDRYTQGYRAPISAKVFAYMGIAAWEAAQTTLPSDYESVVDQLPKGLDIPKPDTTIQYAMPVLLNACYNTLLERFFLGATLELEAQRRDLFEHWRQKSMKTLSTTDFQVSEEYGKKVAMAIFEWSKTDSIAHQAHLHNFDKNYSIPSGEEKWVMCRDFPTPALLPHWGKSRVFLLNLPANLSPPVPAFSVAVNSIWYAHAMEVLALNSPLSEENRWVAEYWSDDHPGLTMTSTGRWISILNQVVAQENPATPDLLAAYLTMGIVLSDATVACWQSKYHYNYLRPETYIQRHIRQGWMPIVHTPSFPTYPSGHATTAAAAVRVMNLFFGSTYALTDRTHEGRTEFKGKPRSYRSFDQIAYENAFSRIALGVHFRFDCEEGLRLGKCVGDEVLGKLQWKKRETK